MNLNPQHVAYIVSLAAGISLLIPLLQSIIQKPWWSPRVKAILAIILSIIAGIAGYIVDHGLTLDNPYSIALWIVGVYTLASNFYARIWRPTGVSDKLEQNINGGGEPHQEIPATDGDEGVANDDDTIAHG